MYQFALATFSLRPEPRGSRYKPPTMDRRSLQHFPGSSSVLRLLPPLPPRAPKHCSEPPPWSFSFHRWNSADAWPRPPPEPPVPPDPPPVTVYESSPARICGSFTSCITWVFIFNFYPLYERDVTTIGPLDFTTVEKSSQTSSYRGQERSIHQPSSSLNERTLQSVFLSMRGVFLSGTILKKLLIFLTILLSCIKVYTRSKDATELIPLTSEVLDYLSKSQSMVTNLQSESFGIQCNSFVKLLVCGTSKTPFDYLPNSREFDDLSCYWFRSIVLEYANPFANRVMYDVALIFVTP